MNMNMKEIEMLLLAISKQADAVLPKNELRNMIELVQAGEPGIGFENFCTQLFGYDVEVPANILTELATVGGAMKIKAHYWEQLKKRSGRW